MPPRFLVRGGRPLRGTIRPAGNKNAALPILAATRPRRRAGRARQHPSHPRRRDDARPARRPRRAASSGPARIPSGSTPGRCEPKPLDPALCARIRASILLAGPLLARFGTVTLPPPGGDVIGRRRVDTHFLALEQLGASVTVGDRYELEAEGLIGADIFLDEPSVTGTENALMAAVVAKGRTVLRNAACEPHVQDLARLSRRDGRADRGHRLQHLHHRGRAPAGRRQYAIGPDHIEIGSFIGLAAVTNGEITIDRCAPRTCAARCSASSGSASARGSRARGSPCMPDQERRIRPIWAATSRSSRTAPGRRSPPT